MKEEDLKPGTFVNASLAREVSTIYIVSVDYKEESFNIIDLNHENFVHLSWFVPADKLDKVEADVKLYRATMKIAFESRRR